MGNKNKNGKEIRIITYKPTNVDYTFIDDGSLMQLLQTRAFMDPMYMLTTTIMAYPKNQKERRKMISYSVRMRSDKLKNPTDILRFKSNKRTKAQSKQNHSPVYE